MNSDPQRPRVLLNPQPTATAPPPPPPPSWRAASAGAGANGGIPTYPSDAPRPESAASPTSPYSASSDHTAPLLPHPSHLGLGPSIPVNVAAAASASSGRYAGFAPPASPVPSSSTNAGAFEHLVAMNLGDASPRAGHLHLHAHDAELDAMAAHNDALSAAWSPGAGASAGTASFNRRGSYFSNNVYVPLGIRKLNAMFGPAGANGSQAGSSSGSGDMGASGGARAPGAAANGNTAERSLLPFKLPPNFGSHVQLFAPVEAAAGGAGEGKSLVVRKKEIYAHLSLIFGAILSGFVVYDYISLTVLLRVSSLRPWLMSIQIAHVASFYLFLLSFIYANEAGDLQTLKKSLLALALNAGSFIARTAFDIAYAPYMAF
ncbi:hypothetical protein H9P43_004847 [Blastocladiella emersonii ATCC 22665]|nr:hypothetical protein H9P43_004847 [Blastocladiella emersonii ATCC 22665]